MPYNSTFRTAVQLTAQARAAAEVLLGGFKLGAFLPPKNNLSLSYEFDVNSLQLADAAVYRAFDATSQFGRENGAQTVQGKLPPISRKLRLNEFQLLSAMGQNDAIGADMETKARNVGLQIGARVALAQGQAVTSGKVTINENGLIATIDFGRAAGNTTTAATPWSTVSADAVSNIDTWVAALVAQNGAAPATAMFSSQIMSALQRNTAIIKAATGRGTDVNSIVSADAVRSVLSSFWNLQVVINDDQVSVNNTPTRIVSSDQFLLLPSANAISTAADGEGALGSTQWGVPAEAGNAKYGIPAAEAAGIFAADLEQEDPEGHNILGSAIVIPTVSAANQTFAADVL